MWIMCSPCASARPGHDWNQVQEPVGHVKGDDAAGLHVSPVNSERFGRNEVHGYRVARERVDRQHVELLRRLPFQRQAGVAQRELDRGIAVLKIREVALCDLHDAELMS
jgi:hypothetical protein